MIFLPRESTNNPAALHAIFVDMAKAYKIEKIPMTQEQSGYFIHIHMANESKIDGLFTDLCKTFPIGGFIGRMDIFPVKLEKRLLLLLALLYVDYGIGGMILIGYYLQWMAHQQKQTDLGIDWMASKVWPFGIFSKETVRTFWDKQKVDAKPDNLIDWPSADVSFVPEFATEKKEVRNDR